MDNADTARKSTVTAARPDPRLTGHMPALDGVRGLAIAMVLAVHFVGNTEAMNPFEKVATFICGYGEYGVDLFFVLSGFLITGILFDAREGAHYFRNFYVRRALRIFPLYFGVLGVLFLILPHIPFFQRPSLEYLEQHQSWAWLYGANVFIAKSGDFNLTYIQHFWSLAVEEHFYLVWPLVVWLAPERLLLRVALMILALSIALRIGSTIVGLSPVAIYVLTPYRLDALVLGGFLSVYARRPGGLTRIEGFLKPVAIGTGAVLVAAFAFNRFTSAGLEILRAIRAMLITALLATLLLAALTSKADSLVGRVFHSKVLRFFGKYSYGLYVFHHFFSMYFERHMTEFTLANRLGSHTLAVAIQATGGLLASIAIAYASFHLFEKRALALKKYWLEPGRASKPSYGASATPVRSLSLLPAGSLDEREVVAHQIPVAVAEGDEAVHAAEGPRAGARRDEHRPVAQVARAHVDPVGADHARQNLGE
jgi:peptidoglycan/LPS O-acetylase OafA/YrhL